MGGSSGSGEWTKDLDGVRFLCLFAGFFTEGVRLIVTIPIAIVLTIKAIWEDSKPKVGQYTESMHYQSYGGGIQDLDTMDIPHSGDSASERAAEYRPRGQSPSGVIDGIYNDTYRRNGVSYNNSNRDWDADA